MKKPVLLVVLAAAAAVALTSCSSPAAEETEATTMPATAAAPSTTTAPSAPAEAAADGTPITITAGDVVLTATLNDTQVSQDFIATLPATLPWFRNYGIEYISELSAPLTETGPFYTDVQPGDIVYYNPADSITIIYEETSSVPTLTKMGEITSDLSIFENLPDNVEMTVGLQ
ncbi:cyclophilin-like fold protein [Glutamicibacter arilaitensis]|uniref:cyclophilin-like fold protein n=1 Tax=Glutamicibacter arilaitensis TaxID=256701 RepID=UPI0016793BC3|nr:cyclophilin-like fold protein [Glutamicibacter arilaitensis]